METKYLPEFQTALHYARLWKVVALQQGMDQDAATDFAVRQGSQLLLATCQFRLAGEEGPELIRAEIRNFDASASNLPRQPGPIDSRA